MASDADFVLFWFKEDTTERKRNSKQTVFYAIKEAEN